MRADTRMLNFLRKHVTENDLILDLGCGDRKYQKYFHNRFLSVDAWSCAKPDLLLDIGKERLPFMSETFDVVWMLDVIEHLEKHAGLFVLAEAKRVCRRELILLTPLKWKDNAEPTENPDCWYFGNHFNYHKSLWTPEDFEGFKTFSNMGGYFLGVWKR